MPDDPPADPPLVLRVEPVAPPVVVRPRPRPGLIEAALYTLAYAVVLFGTIFGIVGLAVLVLAATGGNDALKLPEGAGVGTLPPALAEVTGYAVVAAYVVALAFTLLALRLVVGGGWVREIGLDRFPPGYLALAAATFPAFTVGSDLLGQLVTAVFGPDPFLEDSARGLADLLRGFHWSFAVLAIGVCPGVAEELWCRGFLGRGLVGRYGPVLGVLLTSGFFGLLHAWPPAYVFLTAVMGAALHFTYLMSRSLWVPVVIHLLNNSVAALGAVGKLPEPVANAATEASAGLVVLTLGTLGLTGAAFALGRFGRSRGPAVAVGALAAAGSAGLVWLVAG